MIARKDDEIPSQKEKTPALTRLSPIPMNFRRCPRSFRQCPGSVVLGSGAIVLEELVELVHGPHWPIFFGRVKGPQTGQEGVWALRCEGLGSIFV